MPCDWGLEFPEGLRACVELNGSRSGERMLQAGLARGSILLPTLFFVMVGPLAAALRSVPRTARFLCAMTPVSTRDITEAVMIHQLWTNHWIGSIQYLHRSVWNQSPVQWWRCAPPSTPSRAVRLRRERGESATSVAAGCLSTRWVLFRCEGHC